MKNITQIVLVVFMLATASCAPKNWDSAEEGAFDPFEEVNRDTYDFNKGVDKLLLKPAASVYGVLPPAMKDGVGNFINNLAEPFNAVNHVLQKNGTGATNSLARFVFNSSFGLGGLIAAGDRMGIEEQDTDLGQTIRAYCQTDNPYFSRFNVFDSTCANGMAYVVLPILGPSTVTDTTTDVARSVYSPVQLLESDSARAAIAGTIGLHKRWELLDETDLIEGIALDEYSFVRDAYEEYRKENIPAASGLWL